MSFLNSTPIWFAPHSSVYEDAYEAETWRHKFEVLVRFDPEILTFKNTCDTDNHSRKKCAE